jgi:RNA polymerase sigma-B factor
VEVLDADLSRAEDRTALQQAIAALTDQERHLLSLYFDRGLHQRDIATLLGCSQMHISRTLRRVLVKLRRAMT